jgi:hypothetical protein
MTDQGRGIIIVYGRENDRWASALKDDALLGGIGSRIPAMERRLLLTFGSEGIQSIPLHCHPTVSSVQ